MTRGIFVTGTDTGVGKTVVAIALLRGLRREGVRAIGMKPVSAGIDASTGRNEDVDALREASGIDAPLADRNPFALVDAVAPHLAALHEHRRIDLETIRSAYDRLAEVADAIVVEGAGGALVPLDERFDMLDIARSLRIPAFLVVGVRLGCLNHARASALAIRSRGVVLQGWCASRIDPSMPLADENVEWLARELGAPLIADIGCASPPPFAMDALTCLGLVQERAC
ncbi:MAG TPA: dethiobiotin synthase [Casimicrobiaceae bacterium]|nr:dethiobiotin synthase [Casimicrobiaceae bacterium]